MSSKYVLVMAVAAVLGLSSCASKEETQTDTAPRTTSASPSDSPSESRCDPVPPRSLPSGAAPGQAHTSQKGFVWGAGPNRVVQQVGNPLQIQGDWPQRVAFRDGEAMLVPIGDPGQIAFVFKVDGCTYTTWIGPGFTTGEAQAYISAY
jgi:hypothetical protein